MSTSKGKQQISANVDGLASGGEFVCNVIDSDSDIIGKKAFIRNVVPGEVIEAEIITEKKSFLKANLIRIIEPSNNRALPPCSYYSLCGGCDLQHINLDEQRELKRQMIASTLKFQAGVEPVNGVNILGSDLPGFHYKRRITLHLNQSGELGFYKRNSNTVVDIEKCYIATALINNCIIKLKPYCQELAGFFDKIFIEETDKNVYLAFIVRPESKHKTEAIINSLNNVKHLFQNIRVLRRNKPVFIQNESKEIETDIDLPVAHFSQGNEAGNKLLISSAISHVKDPSVVELYAGSGNFSLPLARAGHQVTLVETSKVLLDFAKKRAEQEGLTSKLRFMNMSCEKFIRKAKLANTIVLDPPRSGAEKVIQACNPKSTETIVYVSCNLASLCRDIKKLVSAGYNLEQVDFIDMFAQTHHVETVSVLKAQ